MKSSGWCRCRRCRTFKISMRTWTLRFWTKAAKTLRYNSIWTLINSGAFLLDRLTSTSTSLPLNRSLPPQSSSTKWQDQISRRWQLISIEWWQNQSNENPTVTTTSKETISRAWVDRSAQDKSIFKRGTPGISNRMWLSQLMLSWAGK